MFLVITTKYLNGHFEDSSAHNDFDNIQPRPGKKSVRYRASWAFESTSVNFPLSFHAEMHHNVGSVCRSGRVPRKYSKISGDTSKSSV